MKTEKLAEGGAGDTAHVGGSSSTRTGWEGRGCKDSNGAAIEGFLFAGRFLAKRTASALFPVPVAGFVFVPFP